MQDVMQALARALRSLLHVRMLALSLLPMLLALALWGALTAIFWNDWIAYAIAALTNTSVADWLARWDLQRVTGYAAVLLILLLLFPLALATALLIAAIFLMPIIVSFVAKQKHPGLEKKQGGTVAGSLWNAAVSVVVFGALWLATLPVYLLGPLAIVIPALLSAYLNQRLFRYDALAEHASSEEIKAVIERSGGSMYLLGGAAGLLNFVPLLNLLTPTFTGLAFAHFCLEQLERVRRAG
ncbi:MAG TPA: EI24 domain-containing protein [Burkholderiales bacterium]|nr:EI24 domain-containing protein [Burkholderiales bacterium]